MNEVKLQSGFGCPLHNVGCLIKGLIIH